MINPWKQLPNSPPYVLEQDRDYIEKFNKGEKNNLFKINLSLLPDPFVGNPRDAEVIFLQLNPGMTVFPGIAENNEEKMYKTSKLFFEACRDNFCRNKMEYPFFYLNPDFLLSAGFVYWSDKLRYFLNSKKDYERISKKICCIEYFPYHSHRFKKLSVPSQEYSFNFVKQAILDKKLIILLRGEKNWLQAIPELKDCYVKTKSAQNTILSKNNLSQEHYEKLKQVLS